MNKIEKGVSIIRKRPFLFWHGITLHNKKQPYDKLTRAYRYCAEELEQELSDGSSHHYDVVDVDVCGNNSLHFNQQLEWIRKSSHRNEKTMLIVRRLLSFSFSKTHIMHEATDSGQDIELTGKSGNRYVGKIYSDKESTSALTGRAIALLTNSSYTNNGWMHRVNSIYNTENVTDELKHFQTRDDISHLILLPYSENENGVQDKVDDLIRAYLHGTTQT